MKEKTVFNIYETPHECTLDGFTYYFTTYNHMSNFLDKWEANRETINTRLSNRYRLDIELNILCDLYLYTVIENRGFRVKYNGEEYRALWQIKLNGVKVTRNV